MNINTIGKIAALDHFLVDEIVDLAVIN
jgi:hypothetical protein